MLLYNVTVKIQREAESEWLQWMQDNHIPDVLNTQQFMDALICRLLEQPDEEDPTYVIQYRVENREKLEYYLVQYAPALRDEHNRRYHQRFTAFRTVMEII